MRIGFRALLGAVIGVWVVTGGALAADRAAAARFVEVSGFDKALASIPPAVMEGGAAFGGGEDAFTQQWKRAVKDVFDLEGIEAQALDMMEAILPDDSLALATDFYASPLGLRLVAVENETYSLAVSDRAAAGQRLLEEAEKDDPERVALIRAFVDSAQDLDHAVQVTFEIQLRYLLTAMASGAIEPGPSEEELRMILEAQAPQLKQAYADYMLRASMFTYREISNEDMRAYTEALDGAALTEVYEVLNGIYAEILAQRFEALAVHLGAIEPEDDL